jgi:serine/threonine-protein kinase
MPELNLIGTTLGRFEILSELGRGGMAVVYKARQTDLDRIVALKILPPALTHDSAYVARFRQEARSAARLEHPHIMPVYEVGEASGLHYIAMKFIAGRTLKDLLHQEGALEVARAATLLGQVGDALDYAHREGLIHRDIKPSNMMVTGEGWVYLTDFGLARGTGGDTAGLTVAGTVMGTPEYMSPEQAQGLASIGPATDIYALGVVLYELLTGGFPFQADTPMGMLAARLLQAPTPPRDVRGDLPPAVEDVVMRALARKPEARFPSAGAMVAALRAAAGIGAGEPQRPATPRAGTPAVGATIAAPAVTPPPYVRPASPAPATVSATAPAPQSALSLPAGAPPQAPPRKSNTLLVVVAALALAMVAGCVGLLALGSDNGPEPGALGLQTAVASGDFTAALGNGDNALAKDGGFDEAIKYYQEALAITPEHPDALAKLALAHSARYTPQDAADFARRLIDAPGASPSQVALGHGLLARALVASRDLLGGLSEAEAAVAADPGLSLGHAVQAHATALRAFAARDAGQMDQALDMLGSAEDALGDDPPLIQALALSANAQVFELEHGLSGDPGYRTQSEAAMRRAIELQPSLGGLQLDEARLMRIAGDDESYRAELEDALTLDPGLAAAQSALGLAYVEAGDTEQAQAALDAALRLDDRDYQAYYGKGRLAFKAADTPEAYAAAIDTLREALSRNPDSAEVSAYIGESYLFKGFGEADAEARQADYAEGERAYRAAIARDDRYAFALAGLGWVLQYQERYDESVAAFQQAIPLDDGNEEHHNGLAWSLYNLGKYDEAEASFRAAIARDTDSSYASAHYGLGKTLEQLGLRGEARAEYEAALQIDPDYGDAREALEALGS